MIQRIMWVQGLLWEWNHTEWSFFQRWKTKFLLKKCNIKLCFIVPILVTNYEVKQNAVHLHLKCHLCILFSLILWVFLGKISLQAQYLAKLEIICKNSTWSWQLWHMCLGIVRDKKIYENWVHVGVTCHNTTLSAYTCFCDSQYHLPQTAEKANLLHRSLLGKIFQDHGKGCDEETGGTRHQKR